MIWFLLLFLWVCCGIDAISHLPEATRNYERLEREAYEEVVWLVKQARGQANR